MHTIISSVVKYLRSKQLWRGSIPYTAALFVILNLFVAYNYKLLKDERSRNLLQDMSYNHDSREIRYDQSNGEDTTSYLKYVPNAIENPLVVIIGMSQMATINERKPDDQFISEWLDDLLRPKGVRVFGLSAPNITNEEVVLMFLTMLSNSKTKPKVFIYGVCFDKFRNIGLRVGYKRILAQRLDLQESWRKVYVDYNKEFPEASLAMRASLDSILEEQQTERLSLEKSLRDVVAYLLPIANYKKEINGWVMLRLFILKNWIFQIKPTTKRAIIKSRYELNQEFASILIDLAKKNNIKPIFYIVPLNPAAQNPYIPEQYGEFKLWLLHLCQEKEVPLANFESIVPTEDWGVFMGAPDYKHFKGIGHKITANAIKEKFNDIFDQFSAMGTTK